jgi:polyisoprenoid-binding protein YceI
MKPLLSWIGVAALVAWTAGGAAAWLATKDHLSVTIAPGATERAPADDPALLLAADVAALRADLSALAGTLGPNLELLDQRSEERSAAAARELAALRVELARIQGANEGALLAEVRALRAAVAERGSVVAPAPDVDPLVAPAVAEASPVPTADGAGDALATGAEPASAPDEPAPAAPRAASFLAFTLPSDDFRFDERRRWTVVPSLSRVGFDGTSTLHDFTGTTSAVTGSMEFDLAHPQDAPAGSIGVDARSVRTGSEGRDEEMFHVLDTDQFGSFEFELAAFEPTAVDAATSTVKGTARGQLTIRGVTREVAMPVTASVDASRRLVLEGEVPLHLPDFGVPVPNKLGLITMGDDVRLWIALRAKLEPRAAAGAKS